MANKRGRKRKSGQRYPSGDLKPEIAPALWGRTRQLAAPMGDWAVLMHLTRLKVHGVLNVAQMIAGYYVGDIYRYYSSDRRLLKVRNWRSSSNGTEPHQNSREPLVFSAETMGAKEWCRVENELETLPRNLRNAAVDLCVFNEPIHSMMYPELRRFLDRIVPIYEPYLDPHQIRELKVPKPRRSTNVSSRPSDDTDVASTPSDDDILRQAVDETLSALRPDVSREELSDSVDMFFALRDRAVFRHEKIASEKTPRRESPGNPRARKE